MSRDLALLLFAQFLTAFADNAILFTAIAMVMQAGDTGAWYIPALQASFLVAFVLLAPWVGPYADARPKAVVLTTANAVKATGALLMLLQVDALLAYAVVGIGAAMYSPAKYGILPELVPHDQLVRANGWIESSTILAILTGMAGGAWVADHSITGALLMVIALFALSGAVALVISRTAPRHPPVTTALKHFVHMTQGFMATSRARFAVLGSSLFWAAAATLRVIVVVWAPLVLFLDTTFDISLLTLASAVGIAIGALLSARVIPLEYLRRARWAAYAMGLGILLLSQLDSLWPARIALLLIGIAGGLFVVPINAALQEIGHKTVGSGGAVAVQHFFENLAMMLGTGLYAAVAGLGMPPAPALFGLGLLVLAMAFAVSRRLPALTGDAPNGNDV